MVSRSIDRPRTMTERVAAASAHLEQVDRELGRGAPAMRNGAKHVMLLDKNSQRPFLRATNDGTPVDSGVIFDDGGASVVGADGVTPRDWSVRELTAAGLVTADGMMLTGNAIRTMYADGALRWDADGAMAIATRDGSGMRGLRCSRVATTDIDMSNLFVDTRARAANWSSSQQDGAIRWGSSAPGALEVMNYAGNAYKGVYATNFAPPPSWRSYKRDFRSTEQYLGRPAGEVVDDLEISAHRYDPAVVPTFDCDEDRYGPILDELPEQLRVVRTSPEFDAEGNETGRQLDHSSPDIYKLLSLALATIQEDRREIADLRRRVEDLERRAPAVAGQ